MTTPSAPMLYPLNDFSVMVTLKAVDPVTGRVGPLITGTVTAFLATSNTPTATAADPTLTCNAVHTGSGKWLVSLDATVLTYALLDGLFASVTPILIVQQPGGVRGYTPLVYAAERPMTVV